MDNLQEIFDKMIPEFCNIFENVLEQIILYGSVAKGQQTEESDIDIALLVRGYTEEIIICKIRRDVNSDQTGVTSGEQRFLTGQARAALFK